MRALLMTLPLLALAACDKSPSVSADNASPEEVARQIQASGAASSLRMNPGEWVADVKLDDIDMPGMSPSAVDNMKSVMSSQVSGFKYCLTPEKAAKPSEDFFGGAGSGCTYDHFELAGGRISGTMRCGQRGGASQTVAFNGTYSPTRYDMTMKSTVEGGQQGSMTMATSIHSKRVGDCTPGEAGASN